MWPENAPLIDLTAPSELMVFWLVDFIWVEGFP
jgi:hypothetical protein